MHGIGGRRGVAAVVGALAFALTLGGCAADEPIAYVAPAQAEGDLPEATVAQLQDAVSHAMDAAGASGAIVGVWVPWSGSWVAGLGTQSAQDETPVDPSMSFRIADVTRLMTCDTLYALADRGTVHLDDPVTTYVSGVPDLSHITLVDLCDGASGLGSSEASVRERWLKNPSRTWSVRELAGYGLERKRIEPRTVYRDSDAGYLLLGLALERATGKDADELYRTYVTGPLGLRETSLPSRAPAAPGGNPLKGSVLPRVDGGFDCEAPTDITEISSSVGYTDSGAVSTIADLGRYVQATAAQALRTQDEPDRFGHPLPAAQGAPTWHQAGGGAFLAGSLIGQHGWVPGYLTAAYSDPATGFTVAVVLNDSSAGGALVGDLAWELAAIASKAPAAEGQTAPEFGLPFTAEQYAEGVEKSAICAPADDSGEEENGEDEE